MVLAGCSASVTLCMLMEVLLEVSIPGHHSLNRGLTYANSRAYLGRDA